MARLLDYVYQGAGVLAGIFLVLIAVLVMAQIIGRIFGYFIPVAAEFATYSLAATTFLGLAYSFRRDAHIRVTLFIDRASPRLRRLLQGVALLIASVMMCFFAWHSVLMVWQSWEFNAMTTGIVQLPIWIPQLSMGVGMFLFALAIVEDLLRVILGSTPTYEARDTTLQGVRSDGSRSG